MNTATIGWGIPKTRFGIDNWLCGAVAVLLLWGLVMVASASVAQAEKLTGDPFYFFFRQLLFMTMGGGIGFAMYCVPMRQWQRSSTWLFILALGLLVLVLIPGIGVKVNAARRWINIGVFGLQASEPVRLALIIYVASYITRRQQELQTSFKGLAMPV
ncbi:MAG TPA: FtsW/RodA/SpoVE family cell cycle protein, partial [Solimonas sp.]